ncbi:type II secretion system protein F [Halobacillus andaensis]|uniref:Type II secretion system protein F n=1 Tax=Halobacillus andaensis TaxID=1176239 RepID=A0A917B7W1_HALAA|nr:type II secretion system F family protein [Halobacillus andaensis]MBP2006062.1 tight adherence protein B [Halobacillus andaensis]GGF23879.1 type II secretion system protein F [Halobacillus andaensis]
MDRLMIPLLVIVFVLLTLLFYRLILLISKRSHMKKRVYRYTTKEEEKKKKEKSQGVWNPIKRWGNRLDGLNFLKKWENEIVKANKAVSPGEFFLLRILAAAVISFLGFLYELHWAIVITLGILGFFIPVYFLRRAIHKRLDRCSHQLNEALGTMANAMRAGFSFMQAMKLVSEEYPDPLGTEFKKVNQDIQYGVPMETAFERMIERLPDKELEMTVKAVLIQRTSGGNLSALLETVQETINGRVRIKDEVKALTAQGKLSSLVVTLLPVALGFYLQAVNPEYFNQLYEHPIGVLLLVFGGAGILIGWLMLRKIVRIEV